MRIHWCGTGLSAIPGLRRLILAGHPVTVWNLPVEAAVAASRVDRSLVPADATVMTRAGYFQKLRLVWAYLADSSCIIL